MPKWYYHKLGSKNIFLSPYLCGNVPSCVIFWGNCTASSIRQGLQSSIIPVPGVTSKQASNQLRNFFEAASNGHSRIVTIHQGKLYLGQSLGLGVVDSPGMPCLEGELPKTFPVKVQSFDLWLPRVPSLISTMGAAQNYSRNTFTEIVSEEHHLALASLVGDMSGPVNSSIHFTKCLGHTELETLVAKLFEEYGCHLPSYRGGTTAGVDVAPQNRSSSGLNVNEVTIPAGGGIGIQVKRTGTKPANLPPGVWFLSASVSTNLPNLELGGSWLANALTSAPKTEAWLKQSLSWVPAKYWGTQSFGI